jgi:hypothetical protein
MATYSIPTVDIFVFRREGVQLLYLMLHGAPESRLPGLWQVLSAEIRMDETAFAAALRGLREGVGLEPVSAFAPDVVRSAFDPLTDRVTLHPVFAFEVESGTLTRSTGYDASRWITFEQSIDLLRLSGHRDGLRHIHEDIALKHDRGAPFRVHLG